LARIRSRGACGAVSRCRICRVDGAEHLTARFEFDPYTLGHLTTWSRCDVSRWNSSRYSLISFFRAPYPPQGRCFKKRAPSPSFSRSLPTRSTAASSRASRRRRQRHRFHLYYRADDDRQIGGTAQGDCTRVARIAMLFNPATAIYAEYWLNYRQLQWRRSSRLFATDPSCNPSLPHRHASQCPRS
jgi:hypothetical protein